LFVYIYMLAWTHCNYTSLVHAQLP